MKQTLDPHRKADRSGDPFDSRMSAMFQDSGAHSEEATPSPDSDITLPDLEQELERQDAELAEALEWFRQQGDGPLPCDGELLDQLSELDRTVGEMTTTSPAPTPVHSRRC